MKFVFRTPYRSKSLSIILPLTICSLFLNGCWMGADDKKQKKLEGDRVSVLAQKTKLEPAVLEASDHMSLSAPYMNSSWSQIGMKSDHFSDHLELFGTLQKQWSSNIGASSSGHNKIYVSPVVDQGVIYAMDSASQISAYQEQTGQKIWSVSVKPEKERTKLHGGGMAVLGQNLIISTAYGEVLSLDITDGKELWRVSVGSPIRSAPAVTDNKIFILTADNKLLAMNPVNGKVIWKDTGISENASLVGSSSPAVKDNLVLGAYTSGEINALNIDTGRMTWSDNLANNRKVGLTSTLSDIKAPPVIAGEVILAMSHANKLFAIDRRTGIRRWEEHVGGINMPWVSGNAAFIISNEAELIAMNLYNGKIFWISDLKQQRKKPESIVWYGPVLAGDKLWITNSLGELLEYNPENGTEIGKASYGSEAVIAPIVVNNSMLLLMKNGDLIRLVGDQKNTASTYSKADTGQDTH